MKNKKDLNETLSQLDIDLSIDESALDIECLGQTEIAWKYNKLAKLAEKRTKLAHEKVKVCRSVLINEANKNPQECTSKAKPNAGDIEAYYRSNKKYIKLKNRYIQLEYELSLLEDAVWRFNQRDKSIDNLIKLHGLHWFAGPKIPRDLVKEVKNRNEFSQRRSNETVANKMKRGK